MGTALTSQSIIITLEPVAAVDEITLRPDIPLLPLIWPLIVDHLDAAIILGEAESTFLLQNDDSHHLTGTHEIVQLFADLQEHPIIPQFSALTLRDGLAPFSVPNDEAVEDGEGGRESESFGFDNDVVVDAATPTPPLSSPPHQRSSSPLSSDSSGSSGGSIPLLSASVEPENPILDSFIQAIHDQDTAGGPDFLRARGDLYDRVL